MIFSAFLMILLVQCLAPEKASCFAEGLLSDPIQIMCIGVDNLPIFTHFNESKVEFLLWTRENDGDAAYYNLKPFNLTSLDKSPFDATRKTYVFVHGYTNVGTKQWILEAKTKILDLEDANIFSLNFWELVAKTTSDLDYLAAVCNAFKVGNYSAYVFNWINENENLEGSDMYLIGHSLGAHIAGVMAQYMISLPIGKVSRITGLDPAGVLFSPKLLNTFRLGKDQADFVDIIHTNGCELGCYGIGEIIGHLDFFVNGGQIQPGCELSKLVNCSHERAPDLYVESIEPLEPEKLQFTSWPCANRIACNLGIISNCGGKCPNMGFNVGTEFQGTYYLKTNGESPYAKGPSKP